MPVGGFFAAAKAAALALFLLLSLVFLRYTGAGGHLSKGGIQALVGRSGLLAPAVHVVVYAVGTTALVPATVFTLIGAVVFGKFLGTIYNLIGATGGAALSFLAARHLGRDFAARLLRGKVRGLDAKAEQHGFILISYLRLAYFPFAPLNYAAGLTRMRFRDYLGGSALGMLPGILIFTCFLDELTNFGSPADLLTRRFLIPLALFVASFLLPVLVKRLAPALNSTAPRSGT
ncbi:MAG: TVP38/TMEM64 family protein [Candidatus Methylomirabilales bacterium]